MSCSIYRKEQSARGLVFPLCAIPKSCKLVEKICRVKSRELDKKQRKESLGRSNSGISQEAESIESKN